MNIRRIASSVVEYSVEARTDDAFFAVILPVVECAKKAIDLDSLKTRLQG